MVEPRDDDKPETYVPATEPAVPDDATAPDEPVEGADDLPDEVRNGDASAGDTAPED